jgi:transcriptional regulator with GAF, ATPase, and Fis domain
MVVDCGAMPHDLIASELFGHVRGAFTGATATKEGLIEAADAGTVFLDEIGEMPLDLQPQLLRVLEKHEVRRVGETRAHKVDIRVIAATHRDLRRLVQEGKFREDLYFRLAVVRAVVPPLRERREDIPLLAYHFAERLGRGGFALPESLIRDLQAYDWPGNVRELRNVLERAALLCGRDALEASDLRFETPPQPHAGGGASGAAAAASTDGTGSQLTLEELERLHIERVVRELGGRVTEAALRLGIPRSTLYQKIKRYGIALPRS